MPEPTAFQGFDHIDVRVTSLEAVEPFYERLMPALGLPRRMHGHVDAAGDWHGVDAAHPRNATEFHEPRVPGLVGRFIGFIEDPSMMPVATRIAFAVADRAALEAWEERLREFGAHNVERSDLDGYPAVFFEDPAGTRLELCARNPAREE